VVSITQELALAQLIPSDKITTKTRHTFSIAAPGWQRRGTLTLTSPHAKQFQPRYNGYVFGAFKVDWLPSVFTVAPQICHTTKQKICIARGKTVAMTTAS